MWTKLHKQMFRTAIDLLESRHGVDKSAYLKLLRSLRLTKHKDLLDKLEELVGVTNGTYYLTSGGAHQMRSQLKISTRHYKENLVLNALAKVAPKSVVDYDKDGQMIVYTGIRSKLFIRK